jgi:hypothetical protein
VRAAGKGFLRIVMPKAKSMVMDSRTGVIVAFPKAIPPLLDLIHRKDQKREDNTFGRVGQFVRLAAPRCVRLAPRVS